MQACIAAARQQQQQIQRCAHAHLNSVVASMQMQQIPWCLHAGKLDIICVRTCSVQGHKTCKYSTVQLMMPGLQTTPIPQNVTERVGCSQNNPTRHHHGFLVTSALKLQVRVRMGKSQDLLFRCQGPFVHSPVSPWPGWESLPPAKGEEFVCSGR